MSSRTPGLIPLVYGHSVSLLDVSYVESFALWPRDNYAEVGVGGTVQLF
jgi:hypothetical protein